VDISIISFCTSDFPDKLFRSIMKEEDASSSAFSKKNSNVIDCYGGEDRHNSNGDGNINVDDSEFTVDSLINASGGSGMESVDSLIHESGGSGMGWFGGIGTEFLHCLTDNVSPVVSKVASLVHKTAVAVANEISQLERDGELKSEFVAAERSSKDCGGVNKEAITCSIVYSSSSFDSSTIKKPESLILPWEICQELPQNTTVKGKDDEIPVYFTDTELMKKIFALSIHESTFLQPFSNNSPDGNELQKPSLSSYCSTFVMDEPRVKLIYRILDIDENLASVHSRLIGCVPNSPDTAFWKNYFFHCERVRADELCRREKKNETTKTEIQFSSENKVVNFIRCSSTKENIKNDDDESLVPVGSDIEGEQNDDSSYVIQSAPNTGDTFVTSRSIDDDLVLVDTHEIMIREK